ncbi:MAG: hypothetical protein MJZ93_05025 [Paludibacteraceae bacterium]|nr:hypothetical protein [Paludibacteraceae bacterium]
MKKVLFAIAIVVAMGLSMISCKKDEATNGKCYKITYTAGIGSIAGGEVEVAMWLTEEQLEKQKEAFIKEGYTNIIVEDMNLSSMTACYALGNFMNYLY